MIDTKLQFFYNITVKCQTELNCYKFILRRKFMAKGRRGYFSLDWIICLILAIIPFTSVICGIITRVQRGHIIGAILNFLLCPLFWLLDLITMIVSKDITILA
jgi:hypothetical protein